jgi:hypothetical protein
MPVLKEIDDAVPLIPRLAAELTKAATFSTDTESTVQHGSGCLKCARGEGHQVFVR